MTFLLSVLGLVFLLPRVGSEQLVNIALDKIPTQSGTLRFPESGGPFFWHVSNSVDGRTDCRTHDYQTYSGTAALDNPWWQLDLGSVYSIHAIHVLGRLDVNNQLTGFRLWTGPEEKRLSIVYRNSISDYNHGDVWINTSVTARVIKIDLPKDADPVRAAPGPLVLCEVEVYIRNMNDLIKQSSIVYMTDDVYRGYGARYAIDGKYPRAQTESPEACNCCSITAGSEIPWWTIDFRQVRMIGGINITGRQDYYWEQSTNLMISITNTSLTTASWQSTAPVWTINASAQGYFFQHMFQQPRLFRYMTITSLNETLQVMTICEVDFIITACQYGRFGTNCNETCGHCINGNVCNTTDGTCPAGCAPGYMHDEDKTCKTACQSGHFGTNCIETCGHCINGNVCSTTDGTCSAGCDPGYNYDEDRTCKAACQDGRFGTNCNETCGHCINSNGCHIIDGRCPAGCGPGYNYDQDRTCKTGHDTSNKCQPGQYGPNCEHNCGNCIDGTTTCSVTDGTCSNRCAPGYDYAADRTCKTLCLPGHYGSNCTEICGHCIGGITTCQETDGTCPVGCASGYDYAADRTCNTDCHPGNYGPRCSNVCGHCINGNNECLVNNGMCPSGCAPGYNPADSLCKTVCLAGTYGPGCSKRCGQCSGGPGLCSKTDGICLSGDCSMGFTGPTCHTAVNILQETGRLLNTSQSSQFFNRDSSLAIDGLKGLDPKTCNCCSQTKNAEVSWWQVDLSVIVPIEEIVVYGQADAVYEQLSGFSVYLSITESFPDLPFLTEPSSFVNVTYRIDVNGTYARYVRIQRIGVLTICEVEIFVTDRTCPPNTYSLNCIQCGHCKTAFACDEITGRCPNGCEDGYSDDKCIKARDDEDSFSTKYVAGAAVGGAIGGAVVMLLIGGCILMFRRKNKLTLRLPCQTSEDYESPKSSANTENQNAYETLDLPDISDQRNS